MIVKITVEKVSDDLASDGTSEMLIDCIFEGFERKSDEAVIAATDNIRNKARALNLIRRLEPCTSRFFETQGQP